MENDFLKLWIGSLSNVYIYITYNIYIACVCVGLSFWVTSKIFRFLIFFLDLS